MKEKQNVINFWQIKHQIDDEVERLGWSTEFCKEYIETRYNRRSRLVMSDDQLIQFLAKLRSTPTTKGRSRASARRSRRRRR